MTVLLSGEVVCGVRGCLLVFGVHTEIPILSFMIVHSVQLGLPGEVKRQQLATSFDGCSSTQCFCFVGRRVQCTVDLIEMQMNRRSSQLSDGAHSLSPLSTSSESEWLNSVRERVPGHSSVSRLSPG